MEKKGFVKQWRDCRMTSRQQFLGETMNCPAFRLAGESEKLAAREEPRMAHREI